MAISSCEPEVEIPAPENEISISFSADTIFFDTVFTEIRSVTKRLKVYNNASGSVILKKISLGDHSSSPFSIYVNGEKGKEFENIHLLGKDSLLILIEAEIDHQNQDLPFVIEEQLIVAANESYEVPVLAWGQDAIFLKDSVLSCEMRFTSNRPYLLFGAVLVDTLCTLTVDAGARIYNHKNSTLYVKGSLKINGTASESVIFTNDRFEERYINAPGQWGGIYLLEGSRDNHIFFADISNAEVGIRIGNPDDDQNFDLIVGHSTIRNMSTAGILSFTSDVFIYNSLIHNCVTSSVAAVAGGTYRIWNSTLANYSYDFFREDATLILSDNIVLADNSLLIGNLSVDLKNNIIWGSAADELIISDTDAGGNTQFSLSNNIIRTEADSLRTYNLVNADPLFLSPSDYDYRLDSSSVAVDAGATLPGIETDRIGNVRINFPDLGAFENQ